MSIEHIADHEARGVALLIERYRQPRVSALLASWLHEVQVLEDVFTELLSSALLMRQLDVLGRLVGQPRDGRDDATYWVWIQARIRANRSSGAIKQLMAIAQAVGVTGLRLEEQYPAALVIHGDLAYGLGMGREVAKLLQAAKAAGVALYFHWFEGTPFRFAPGAVPADDDPGGFDHGTWSAASDGADTWYGGPG